MFIKRAILPLIKNHLRQKEITLLIGPRQAGKTTIMLHLKDLLEKEGKKTLFLNLDIENDFQFFYSQEKLIQKIELEIGKNEGYVFIDEIQRKENAGIFLKGIYDMNLPYKFIISGSGSLELKEKIHEGLVGRKRLFMVNPLSFGEFFNFKTNYRYEGKEKEFFSLEPEKGIRLLGEYLNFGGYPRVVLAETLAEKIKSIEEIYQSYLEKDISYLLKIKKTAAYFNLVKLLADQIGRPVNFTEISSTLGISLKTVKEYLWFLEKTFILEKVSPYFSNLRKEITKSPVYYFLDLGLRNYALGFFGNISFPEGAGFLFQNFVFLGLKEKRNETLTKIYFWRTKDGAEVDFVLSSGRATVPVEVRCQYQDNYQVSRSFRSFIEKYQPASGYIINLNFKDYFIIKKTKVYFLPFFLLSEISP